MTIRIINTLGTHNLTSADNDSLIVVKCEVTLVIDQLANLTAGWQCRIKNKTNSSAIITIVRADSGIIDGATQVLLPFTHDNLHLVYDGEDILALDQWYRRQGIVSHRTVTVQNIGSNKVWSAGVKDIGAVIRCSCAAVGSEPASSMMILLPPLAQIGGPSYRRGGLHIQRIDPGVETVTVFAANNEAPINGFSSGYQVQGAFTWREFYTDGQMWFVR